MKTYHVSEELYPVGRVVSTNNYFEITKQRGNQWIEALLLRHKPEIAPSRIKCVFTFPDLEQALAFGATLNHEVNYYTVEIDDNPFCCPMVLCGTLEKEKAARSEILESLAKEYWNPVREWAFYEYLSSTFTVVERLENVDSQLLGWGIARYQGDKVNAKAFVKELKKTKREKLSGSLQRMSTDSPSPLDSPDQ